MCKGGREEGRKGRKGRKGGREEGREEGRKGGREEARKRGREEGGTTMAESESNSDLVVCEGRSVADFSIGSAERQRSTQLKRRFCWVQQQRTTGLYCKVACRLRKRSCLNFRLADEAPTSQVASGSGQGFTPGVRVVDPGKFTWNLKMDLWKTTFLYKPVVFRFHVGLFRSADGRWSVVTATKESTNDAQMRRRLVALQLNDAHRERDKNDLHIYSF